MGANAPIFNAFYSVILWFDYIVLINFLDLSRFIAALNLTYNLTYSWAKFIVVIDLKLMHSPFAVPYLDH